jgi:outer membrane protein OmpA-like peptidoglycan-associated protein
MRRRHRVAEEDDASFWISFSDVATALLMAFLLVIVILMLSQQQKEAQTRQRLEALVGVRESLIAELKQEFKNEFQQVRVDERTGALELPSSILFDYNKSDLTPGGKTYLTGFFRKYVGVLLSPKFASSISQIDIEGHADPDGDYLFNMVLTQNRALSVCKFLFDPAQSKLTPQQLGQLRPIVSVNGRSNVDPLYRDQPGAMQVDAVRSRRVTFKFRLKDDQLIKELKRLLKT